MEKTKASQTETIDNQLVVKSVSLNDRESSAFLVPELQKGQKLAVVDEGVLKFLTSLLPKARFYDIKSSFIDDISKTENLEDMVRVAKETVVFHETVNLMKTYFNPDVKVTLEKPFNVAEPAPERTLEWMQERAKVIEDEAHQLMAEILSHPDYKSEGPKEVYVAH